MRPFAVALVHYPVLDKNADVRSTAVTSVDVHDIARSCRTYGCDRFFIVHPVQAERELVAHIRDHWTQGEGCDRNSDRSAALELVEVVESIAVAREHFGSDVEIWATSARCHSDRGLSHGRARMLLGEQGGPILLLLGTGYGLTAESIESAAHLLDPIEPEASYNHLSVRAAAAILLDRLRGSGRP